MIYNVDPQYCLHCVEDVLIENKTISSIDLFVNSRLKPRKTVLFRKRNVTLKKI